MTDYLTAAIVLFSALIAAFLILSAISAWATGDWAYVWAVIYHSHNVLQGRGCT